MLDWKRIVVGDAFRLPSRNLNYYRDLFLLWPFLLFAIAGAINLLASNPHHRILGVKCLGLAVAAIVLARERRILFLGALGFCAVRFLVTLALTRDWRALVGLLATGIPVILSARFVTNYKPSYDWPDGLSIADLVVGLSSLLLTLESFTLIDR
jgi:hypothetical protein